MPTRRSFLKSAAGAAAVSLGPTRTLSAAVALLQNGPSVAKHRLADGWEYVKGPLSAPWEAWHSEETAVWTKVAMPHSFNHYDACDPDVSYYRGPGWYRTHVAIANPHEGGRTLLHFEGAGQTCAVYVGATLAGQHTGGYDEFVVDITDALKNFGDLKAVPLAVLCDNTPSIDRMPSDLSDFSLYGGLYRHVNLVYVPALSIEALHVKSTLAAPDAAAQVELLCRFYAPESATAPRTCTVAIEVKDDADVVVYQRTAKVAVSGEQESLAQFAIEKPHLWSPRTPRLYRCNVKVSWAGGEYSAAETFGLKHTQMVEHGPFILNGERLLLRGTHRHEDHAFYANAMPDELIEREMQMIKSMGANFIRLAHYQQSRRVLEACDRLGILVWEEVPWCRAGIGTEALQAMGKDKLRAMIAQHFNHVSVLFWGLGNEDDWPTEYPGVDHEKIRGYMQELNELAHELDPSRYTSYRRCDFARDIPDVYSPSIWAGWYSGVYTEYQASLEKQRERVKHLIHIEWGADSHAGRHSENPDRAIAAVATGHGTDERGLAYLNRGGEARVSKDGDWSETYACNLFDWHLKTQEALPWLTGAAQWIFKDFTTPLRSDNPVPRVNQKGVVQRDLTPKESFYVFQSFWAEEPMAHIYGHTWPVRWGAADEKKLVKVYSNCDTAELFVNGVSVGTKTRDSQNFPAAGLRWTTAFRPGRNELHVVAKKGSATVRDHIEFVYQTEAWGKPAELRLVEKTRAMQQGKPVVTVEATLHDGKGVLCVDAKNPVRFSVAGGATMIDNLGTPKGSRLVQMYNGRAEISVLPAVYPVTVAVSSDGLPSAMCTFGEESKA